jgi:hypothetical protein
VIIRGTGSNRELVINDEGIASGAGDFILVVKDEEGASSLREFTVHFGGEASAPVIPALLIARDGARGLTLIWEGDALLYVTQDLNRPFQSVPAAISPYKVDVSQQAFFKLGLKP